MSSYDLPTVVKFLKIHGAIACHLALGVGKRDGPPSEGKSQIRLEEFDLDTHRFNVPHVIAIRIAVNVGIVKLLPAAELLGIDNDQQLRRFPVELEMAVNIVSVPATEHDEQDFVDLLAIGFGRTWSGSQRVEDPFPSFPRHYWQGDTEQEYDQNSAKRPATHGLRRA